MRHLLVFVWVLLLAACGEREPAGHRSQGGDTGKGGRGEPPAVVSDPPSRLRELRRYGFDATVADPQPAWHPDTHHLAVRTIDGLAILDEGQGRQAYFTFSGGETLADPAWLDSETLVVAPLVRIRTAVDGRVLLPVGNLRTVRVGADSMALERDLGPVGYHPKPWHGAIVVARGEELSVVDPAGEVAPLGRGFAVVPQASGPGLAWQSTPVFEVDHWTGREGLGELIVRWNDTATDLLPGGCGAAWTAAGGVVATRLGRPPTSPDTWWAADPEVWHLAGPDAAPELVQVGAYSPAPHPELGLLAVVRTDGAVVLLGLDGRGETVVGTRGRDPSWSADGTRLSYLTPTPTGLPRLQVVVFAIE